MRSHFRQTVINGSVGAIFALVGGSPAWGQSSSASATAFASASIISSIAIENSTGLSFGEIVPGATAGMVGISSAATFTVTGEPGATYSIVLPASATIRSGPYAMTVDSFISDPGGTGALAGSSQTFDVGGTLSVEAGQAAGSYAGTFEVTAAYN